MTPRRQSHDNDTPAAVVAQPQLATGEIAVIDPAGIVTRPCAVSTTTAPRWAAIRDPHHELEPASTATNPLPPSPALASWLTGHHPEDALRATSATATKVRRSPRRRRWLVCARSSAS